MVGAVTVELLELVLLLLESLPPQPPMLTPVSKMATAAAVREKDCHPVRCVRFPFAAANNRFREGAGAL
jgi:hypothetical protein